MVKCTAFPDWRLPWILLYFHSSIQLSNVLCSLVLCPHSSFYYFVPRLCPARQCSRCVHCFHGECSSPGRGFFVPIYSWNTRRLRSLAWSGAVGDWLPCSLFIYDIECHSTSFRLTSSSFSRWVWRFLSRTVLSQCGDPRSTWSNRRLPRRRRSLWPGLLPQEERIRSTLGQWKPGLRGWVGLWWCIIEMEWSTTTEGRWYWKHCERKDARSLINWHSCAWSFSQRSLQRWSWFYLHWLHGSWRGSAIWVKGFEYPIPRRRVNYCHRAYSIGKDGTLGMSPATSCLRPVHSVLC